MKLLFTLLACSLFLVLSCGDPQLKEEPVNTDETASPLSKIPEVNPEKQKKLTINPSSEKLIKEAKSTDKSGEAALAVEDSKTSGKLTKKEIKLKEKKKKRKSSRSSSDKKEKAKSEKEDYPIELKKSSTKGTPVATFASTIHDFGHIAQGEKITHDFVFTNTGDADLEILNVDVTCGCTVPTFPFIPIAPGEKGTISVTYNSTGKLGNQKPMITIITDAKPRNYKLYFKGVVDADRVKTDNTDPEDNN